MANTKTEEKPDIDFVAVTDIHHGDDDGVVTVIPRGSTLSDYEGVDEDLIVEWYASGSVAVKGTKDDPNTLPVDPHPYETTPAVVEQSLKMQARQLLAGHKLVQGHHTQPGYAEPPEDPEALLRGVNNPDGEMVEPTPRNQSTPGPTSVTAAAVATNAESENRQEPAKEEAKRKEPEAKPEPEAKE
jgi:hypothetical protein